MSAIIILPGIGGSEDSHWQTAWEKSDSSMVRFQPSDWDNPDLDDWLSALDLAIEQVPDAPILVAHSLACLLVAHWAARDRRHQVRGAFLVGVPDPNAAVFPGVEAASFRAVPETRFPFPGLIVASTDDPYGTISYARDRAAVWGTGFVVAGALGHMNSASDLRDWPVGAMLLEAFTGGTAHR
jgi:uncharacterized protein